jgi:hypothetical protein
MMVQAASTMSIRSPVETHKISNQTMSTRACVVSLLKVVDQSWALGMKIPRSIYGWTHHHRRRLCVCVMSLLKVMDQSCALGMKILRSIYGWTRHHRRTCGIFFLKA